MLLTTQLNELIEKTAQGISRAYKINFDDVQQEMYLWVLEHEVMVERNLDPDNAYGEWRIARALWASGKRLALTEAAQRDGYSLDDLYFYDVATIEDLLPYALGIESIADTIMATPEDGSSRRRSNKLPNEGNNFIVMVADVSMVFTLLSPRDRAFLRTAVEFDREWDTVGEAHSMKPESARRRYARAVSRLRKALGGADPFDGKRTGARRVMSNASAESLTRIERDGQ